MSKFKVSLSHTARSYLEKPEEDERRRGEVGEKEEEGKEGEEKNRLQDTVFKAKTLSDHSGLLVSTSLFSGSMFCLGSIVVNLTKSGIIWETVSGRALGVILIMVGRPPPPQPAVLPRLESRTLQSRRKQTEHKHPPSLLPDSRCNRTSYLKLLPQNVPV